MTWEELEKKINTKGLKHVETKEKSFRISIPKVTDFEKLVEIVEKVKSKLPEGYDCYYNVEEAFEISANTLRKKNWTLRQCNFLKEVLINGNSEINKTIILSHCDFKNLVIKDVDFRGYVFLGSCFFHKIEMEKVFFNKGVNFSFSSFPVIEITGITIGQEADFRGVNFRSDVIFNNWNLSNDIEISFREAKFYGAIDISMANLPKQTDFSLAQFTFKDGKNNIADGILIPYGNQMQSFCFLKDLERAKSNHVRAIEFHRMEMEAFYHQEFKYSKWYTFNSEKLVLWLNRTSSDFGTNPLKALSFVIKATLLTYTALILFPILIEENLTIQYEGNFFLGSINTFFAVMNPTDWRVNPFQMEPFEAYFILFLGRIFISYGYYQFIAAFRKYGKN